MKIIFLDFDGVLNSNNFYGKRGHPNYKFEDEPPYPECEFDPLAVELLNQITEKTKADIVISSTWRIGRTLEELQELGKLIGIKGNIIGKTPSSYEHVVRKSFGKFVRGNEIKLWLNNAKTKGLEISKFIIIDDENDMLPEQQPIFIKTTFWMGLIHLHVTAAIKILTKI